MFVSEDLQVNAQGHLTIGGQDTVELAKQYGRYGYRRITAMLKNEGWKVNHKKVERIWRQEGLKVPKKHYKKHHCQMLNYELVDGNNRWGIHSDYQNRIAVKNK